MLFFPIVNDLPQKFGRYELLELLATGGMAHIYRARLTSAPGMTKELVIKQVLPHLAKNRDFIDMFVDEARITMPLTHGNIVQVFEFGQEGDDYFLAMEYVRGRNLETVLSRGRERGEPMPLAVALYIGSEIAKGLDYAHRFRDPHGRPTAIIHRDVSPQNVLVGFQGEVKLTDFGIAKARSKIHRTTEGIIRGKAVYLSPEQAECREIDARSDQFSLGSVLYEMLTGVRPFEGDNEVATLQRVREARVQAPSRLRDDVPQAVDAALLKALAREPGRRFESCGAFQLALSRALADQAPDFTSASLAEWASGLFSQEITHEINDRVRREHLIGQLARNGQPAEGRRLTTGELLEMGTLTMRSGEQSPRRRARWPWLAGLVLLAAGGLGTWSAWPWPADGGLDGGVPRVDPAGLDPAGLDPAAAQPDGQNPADAGPGPAAAGDSQAVDAGPGPDPGPGADAADREEADAPRPPDPPPVRWAYLNLNSSPWAFVELDGRRLGRETPLFKVRVASGRHRLRFFNPELNIEKTKVVTVKSGQTRTISVLLEQDD